MSLAVVGATGLVGAAVVDLLATRQFPLSKLFLVASSESVGSTVQYGGKHQRVIDLAKFDFAQVQLAIFCVPAQVAAHYVPLARRAGCTVIDHSSEFRLDPSVPLIIPEINADLLETQTPGMLIACPEAACTQLILAIYPIYQAVGIKRVDVTTCLPVSHIGRAGVEELSNQAISLLNLKELKTTYFHQPVAFNLILQSPQSPNRAALSEDGMLEQTQKILHDTTFTLVSWQLQAPVFFGTSQVLSIETRGKSPVNEVYGWYQDKAYSEVSRSDELSPSAVTHAAQQDGLYLGRVHALPLPLQGVGMWSVADNIRRGAALGSVQIAEILVKGHL